MAERIIPFTDAGFKRIFGQEPSKELLISFLNSLLEGERKITDVRFLDKEQVKESVENRTLIYDVFCETDTGERVIVEMQNQLHSNYTRNVRFSISQELSRIKENQVEVGYMISRQFIASLS